MFTSLFNLFDSITPLSEELKNAIKSFCTIDDYETNTFLLSPGKISNKVFFVYKGLIRSFHYSGDREHTSWIMKENDIMLSVYSFFSQKPAFEYIETMEKSTFIILSYIKLQQLYHDFPEFNTIGRVITEKYYVQSEARAIALRQHTAEERYKSLLKSDPELVKRVSVTVLASYLGMSRETLSRVRARI